MFEPYLGGKIERNDWRHSIFTDLRSGNSDFFKSKMSYVDGFSYNGPFFVSCDHGCFHDAGNHGLGVINTGCDTGVFGEKGEEIEKQFKRHDVNNKCIEWIKSSDMVFFWTDKRDAYGSITEIGIAHSLNKPIFIGISNQLENAEDMWFPFNLANYFSFEETAIDAWNKFVTLKSKLSKNKNLIDDHANAWLFCIEGMAY
ncbi:hypothetical protein R70723_11880 [Paenibacillus sp. FSL R7-0273]|uniref:hypothetical protein n=1 Tax=Paenibacillus sp. FSL R7-0273 TaxID=1536772 RepID=UPI0004F760C8|nr:hypothetical protein [Paenibacillus sp. FSL R7-0273]AIQ46489.1 hypothetical protein R70723_11880 [Paenibacillus sp. FSL R7-0273]OMF97748.1 hypothetical protein BK144_03705 [Paenibacillus sp. FSL R7-0273]